MPVIKVRGTADTDLLRFGEVREIATSPYVQNLMRLGLIEQVVEPRPVEAATFQVTARNVGELAAAIVPGEPVKKRRRRSVAEAEDAVAQAQVDAENAQVALSDARDAATTELAKLSPNAREFVQNNSED